MFQIIDILSEHYDIIHSILGVFSTKSRYISGFALWSGRLDDLSSSLYIFLFYVLFVYVGVFMCNSYRVAMHFNAPCTIILRNLLFLNFS